MTNREEREEVAKKLRSKFACGLGITPGSIAYALGYTAPKEATYDNAIRELFNRLADLIDPICMPCITRENLTESIVKYTAECSNCGAIFGDFPTIEQAKTTHPVYCPSCGARVVRDA